ncbi:MAG: hypothetical protein ACYDIA_11555 [Candidatus Humimicrobiaceae bacterium]
MVKEIKIKFETKPGELKFRSIPIFKYQESLTKEIEDGNITRKKCLELLEQMLMIRTLTVKRFKGSKTIIFAVWQAFLYPSLIRRFENMFISAVSLTLMGKGSLTSLLYEKELDEFLNEFQY